MSEKIRAASIVRLQSKVDARTGGRVVTVVARVGRKEKRFIADGTSIRRALATVEEDMRGRGLDFTSLGPTHAELDAEESLPF